MTKISEFKWLSINELAKFIVDNIDLLQHQRSFVVIKDNLSKTFPTINNNVKQKISAFFVTYTCKNIEKIKLTIYNHVQDIKYFNNDELVVKYKEKQIKNLSKCLAKICLYACWMTTYANKAIDYRTKDLYKFVKLCKKKKIKKLCGPKQIYKNIDIFTNTYLTWYLYNLAWQPAKNCKTQKLKIMLNYVRIAKIIYKIENKPEIHFVDYLDSMSFPFATLYLFDNNSRASIASMIMKSRNKIEKTEHDGYSRDEIIEKSIFLAKKLKNLPLRQYIEIVLTFTKLN